ELLGSVGALAAIWHRPGPATQASLLAGEPWVEEIVGGDTVRLAGASFIQVNRSAAELLERHVLELAGDVAGLRVIDAYCGLGSYTRALARRGARVEAIELDEAAVAEGRRISTGDATFHAARVEDVLSSLLPADLVVLNPPRTGVDAAVAEALKVSPVPRILYVSCDPATLARDAARLGAGYVVRSVRCFDLFPQTAHVETVAELERVARSGS
ncbi:MAG TPA: hypothetical protein VNZ57_12550, partial [Longimicrobiales bacterium]|nr:hypothetical protein [Longimicrobiales bacterium]